jgi:hypothetical protein
MKPLAALLAVTVAILIPSSPVAAQITCASGSACQTNFVPVFASNGGNATVTDSIIQQSGSTVTVGGNISANILEIGFAPVAFGSYSSGNAFLGFSGNWGTNPSGTYNIAAGYQALYSNTSGAGNTAIGTQALAVNTTAYYNTAVGFEALDDGNSPIGEGDTAIGSYALPIGGTYNTALGYNAGYGSPNLTNSSAIGAFSKVSESNVIAMGGIEQSAVTVAIGTSSPYQDYGLDIDTTNSNGVINGGVVVNANGGNLYLGMTNGTHKFRVSTAGAVYADGGLYSSGADFAESVAVRGSRSSYEPGDVLEIDPQADRHLALSSHPYATLVAGIYSTKPGVLASPHHIDDESSKGSEVPLAVVGIVPCKVTAENGAINRGDLLVTSSTPGYAMKGTDRRKLVGAVVGKALEPLPNGKNKGLIELLITLQ